MENRMPIDLSSPSRDVLREIWAYRFALRNLILKDFRVRYRNMSLGILWSVLNPLVMLGVLVLVFSYIHLTSREDKFPIFLLLGMIPFNFFSLSIAASTNCIVENAALVKKVIFPRHILPLSVVLSQIIHLVIQGVLLAIFMAIFRVPLTVMYLWVPVIFLVELVFVSGLSMMTSALNVYYRDTLYLVQSILTIMFWFTPIFYSLPIVKGSLHPVLYQVYLLNPLAGLIDSLRRVILKGTMPDLQALGFAVVMSVLFFWCGWRLFSRRERHFADRV